LYKREAEAEPETHFYGAYARFGYNYRPYQTYAYAAPHASSFQQVDTPAASYGIRQLHKREAEAEAETHFYGAYARFGYNYRPYQTYAYAAPHASSFQQVDTPAASYGIRQLHKREAEAEEPKATYFWDYDGPFYAGGAWGAAMGAAAPEAEDEYNTYGYSNSAPLYGNTPSVSFFVSKTV
jgi:hypothetical protein